jgi:hypothetical protein
MRRRIKETETEEAHCMTNSGKVAFVNVLLRRRQ